MSTYALCGFANIGAIGIMIGSLSAMVPHRRSEISSLAARAMIVGNVVSFMNACTAGESRQLHCYFNWQTKFIVKL
jgi:pyrimidine nucleoside transport protein